MFFRYLKSKATQIDASRIGILGGIALFAAISLLHAVYYFPRTIDDAYVFFRYATNFWSGNGLVYNPGEHVEGFSSPLWMFLTLFAQPLGLNPTTWVKFLGFCSYFLLGAALWRYAKRLNMSQGFALMPLLVLAFNSYVISWSMLGMETVLNLALLLWFLLSLQECLDNPTKRRSIKFALISVFYATTRPEAPLFMLAAGLAVFCFSPPFSTTGFRTRFLAIWKPALVAVLLIAGLLFARYSYYGLWFPHTYYAKQSTNLIWENLSRLYEEGSDWADWSMLVAGGLSLLGLAVFRREMALLAVTLTLHVFVVSVIYDWMPNGRHLLPIYVIFPLAITWAAQSLWKIKRLVLLSRLLAIGLIGVCAIFALDMAQIDSRFSKYDFASHHGGGKQWKRPKSEERWNDALDSLQHKPMKKPLEASVYTGGMIEQVWLAMEACADPLEDSWVIGRDIGRLGYLVDANIFDTDALFTPSIAKDQAWQNEENVKRKPISQALIRQIFSKNVVSAELMDYWGAAAARVPELPEKFDLISGSWQNPWRLRRASCTPPTVKQLKIRYDTVMARMPDWYYVYTVFGEDVGAIVERHAHYINELAADPFMDKLENAPEELSLGPANFDEAIELLGCVTPQAQVQAGRTLTIDCTWRLLHQPPMPLRVFIHIEAGNLGLISRDEPLGGRIQPLARWQIGKSVRHRWKIDIPPLQKPGKYQIFLGLFHQEHRAVLTSPVSPGNDNRLPLGSVSISK